MTRDPAKALELFRRAAALGDVLASYKVGCYYSGQGEGLVQDDPGVALRYKLVAARAGYALAQQDVAALYAARGETAAAVGWLEKAVRQCFSGALLTYASIHNGAPGVPRDAVTTAAYLRLFVERAEASGEQRAWLAAFERGLTPEQRARAGALVRGYRAEPTALTIKALSGQRAAEALVKGAAASAR